MNKELIRKSLIFKLKGKLSLLVLISSLLQIAACELAPDTSLKWKSNNVNPPTDPQDPQIIKATAKSILQKNCMACHGSTSIGAGGINYIDNETELLLKKKIIPGRPAEESRVFARIKEGTMPPTGPLSEADQNIIREYIEEILKPLDVVAEYDLPPETVCADTKNKGFSERRTWRLTPQQIENSVQDILGISSIFASNFSEGLDVLGYSNNSDMSNYTDSFFSSLEQAATQASLAALSVKSTLLSCSSGNTSNSSCVESFIKTKGRLFFRREITSTEVEKLMAIYDSTKTVANSDSAFQDIIRAFMVSPSFIYRTEIGGTSTNGNYLLSGYEIASLLAFSITNAGPDAELLEKAKLGNLQTSAQIRSAGEGLLNSSKASRGIRQFVSEFLGIKKLNLVIKSPSVINNFSDALKNDMKEETLRFAENVVSSGGSLSTLYSAPYTYLNSRLASHYGVNAQGASNTNFVKVQPSGVETSGILSQGSVMSMFSSASEPSPIKRGKFVREKLLCYPLPDPPPGVPELPDLDPNLSIRDRFALHSSAAQCMGCHGLMDPIGFGMLNYDPVGRFQGSDGGGPINNSGEIKDGGDATGSFFGPAQLGSLLGSSKIAGACFATNYFRYSLGRGNYQSDRCEIAQINKSFFESNMSLKEAILATVSSEAFRTRR